MSFRTSAAILPALCLAPLSAFADAPLAERAFAPVPLLGKPDRTLGAGASDAAREATLNAQYRLGSEWGKKPVTMASLAGETPEFRRAALATARAGGATSFYLGEFAGAHVMATNHHVFPQASRCLSGSIRFPLLDKSFRCEKFLGSWDSVDLAIFVIAVGRADDAKALAEVGANFDFASPLRKGQELLTVGFGVADNPLRALVGNKDSDCKVFSPDDSFRFMADPDRFNPGPYKSWSFANGCDVSHGDSGSAMVDRATGRPVGIIWTGRIPKDAKVQNSAFLADLIDNQGKEVWEELSYAVPAAKIKEKLEEVVADRATDARTREILEAVLADGR